VVDDRPPEDGPGAVSDRHDGVAAFTPAFDVGGAIAVSPDMDEMLSVSVLCVTEALDVWERNSCEDRPENDSLEVETYG
jgi:hypothetical protein